MKKLSALSKHLEALPGIGRDQMEAFVDLGKLHPTGTDLGHGIEVGRFRYDAVISIERCPATLAEMLLSVLLIWLGDNDPNRDHIGLNAPDVDVSLEDEQTVSVQITVDFDEGFTIVPDPKGPIFYEDKQWRIDDVPIDVAEELQRMENR